MNNLRAAYLAASVRTTHTFTIASIWGIEFSLSTSLCNVRAQLDAYRSPMARSLLMLVTRTLVMLPEENT